MHVRAIGKHMCDRINENGERLVDFYLVFELNTCITFKDDLCKDALASLIEEKKKKDRDEKNRRKRSPKSLE